MFGGPGRPRGRAAAGQYEARSSRPLQCRGIVIAERVPHLSTGSSGRTLKKSRVEGKIGPLRADGLTISYPRPSIGNGVGCPSKHRGGARCRPHVAINVLTNLTNTVDIDCEELGEDFYTYWQPQRRQRKQPADRMILLWHTLREYFISLAPDLSYAFLGITIESPP